MNGFWRPRPAEFLAEALAAKGVTADQLPGERDTQALSGDGTTAASADVKRRRLPPRSGLLFQIWEIRRPKYGRTYVPFITEPKTRRRNMY